MFGLVILDIAIGLIFMYLALSLIGSAIAEFVELFLRSRARTLELGLRNLLFDENGNGLARDIYAHPLIQGLTQQPPSEALGATKNIKRRMLPSYIPANLFVTALLDLLTRGPVPNAPKAGAGAPETASEPAGDPVKGLDPEALRMAIGKLKNENVKRALAALLPAKVQGEIQNAGAELAAFRANIEGWFDSSMDRVAGWYKQHTQKVILVIGFFLAVLCNADTLSAARDLSRDRVMRESLVAAAGQYIKTHPPASGAEQGSPTPGAPDQTPSVTTKELTGQLNAVQASIKEVEGLGLPIGWTPAAKEDFSDLSLTKKDFSDPSLTKKGWWDSLLFLLGKLIGWFLTAVAISLGAPFWFDLLNKFMVVRSTIKPQEKSPQEASKDRQPQPTP